MGWWSVTTAWIESWNQTQGFWSAVQGLATLLAAAAALLALLIAKSQLAELTKSNKLLAASNDAMTRSNVALTRPYVVVDFQFHPTIDRAGSVSGTTIAVHVENAGRTPAKNLRLSVDPPFPVPDAPQNPNWRRAVADLNRAMNGKTVIKSLTHVRPITFYLDEAGDIMGTEGNPPGQWSVIASYEDADGHSFTEESVLELSHWRTAMVTVDPMYRIAKGVQSVAYQIKSKQLPRLDFTFPAISNRWNNRPGIRRRNKSRDR